MKTNLLPPQSNKKNNMEQRLKKILEVGVGSIYYDNNYGCFLRVTKLVKRRKHLGVSAFYESTRDGVTWDNDGSQKGVEQLDEYYTKVILHEDETLAEYIKSMKDEMVSLAIGDQNSSDEENQTSYEGAEIIPMNGAKVYEDAALEFQRKVNKAHIISEMMESKMRSVRHRMHELQNRLQKVMKVLGVLELYLGVHEEVYQLTDGSPADVHEPICIRQQVLFMDEETLIFEVYNDSQGLKIEGTINHSNVGEFDEWIIRDGNIDKLLPEKKGVVAIRPTRRTGMYEHLDAWTAAEAEWADKLVYLLIRNGDKLFRVFTSIHMDTTFYPTNIEAERFAKMMSEEWYRDRERAQEARINWSRNMLLIQGVLDRTELLHPLPEARINLSNPETYELGYVRLIRDAENLITDGRDTFNKWRKEINSKAVAGSRVYIIGVHWSKDGWRDRFRHWLVNCPSYPEKGIYTLEEVAERRYATGFWILYMPGDPVWRRGYDDNQRRRRLSFMLYDDEFINYDEIEVADIDYFLQSRLTRQGFVDKIPLLLFLRAERIKELQSEKEFINLLSAKHGIPETRLESLVEWWKRKVIHKRPLTQDDQKAWRMIIKKAKGGLR